MATLPDQLLKELADKLAAIESSDASAAGPHWGAMHKLLLKAKVDPTAIMRLVASRDVGGLRNTIAVLRGEPPVAPQMEAPKRVEVDAAVMQEALRVFRRRLKFAQLDADSKLGVGPMSGGQRPRIRSMVPPREFPIHVWEALADAGKLRREGQGFYAITDEDSDVHW